MSNFGLNVFIIAVGLSNALQMVGGHNHSPVKSDLKCISCVYVENSPKMSNPECENDRPPSKYLRGDCFGFGNLQIAGAVRHSSHSSGTNVHCVKITGVTDLGNKIIFRGCDTLEASVDYKKEYCSDGVDFPYPYEGYVRKIKKCFCKTDGCNNAQALQSTMVVGVTLSILAFIYGTLNC